MPRLLIRPLTIALAVIVALAATALLHPSATYACSCMAPPPPAEASAQSQVVFAGTVSDVASAGGSQGMVLVTFDVSQIWKGPEGSQLTLVTSDNSASCGYAFTPGEEYLVYGMVQEGQLSTNLCSRTAPLASAGEDLAALGEGTGVAATPGAVTEDRMEVPWLPIALAASALLIGAALFGPALMRRRSR